MVKSKNVALKSKLGWISAILFGITIGILFANIFPQNPDGSPLGTICIANPGFLCSNINYNAHTGNVTLTLGQDTGKNWSSAKVVFMPGNTSSLNLSMGINWNLTNVVSVKSILSGSTFNVQLPISGPVNIGYSKSGEILVRYLENNGSIGYVRLGSVTLSAV